MSFIERCPLFMYWLIGFGTSSFVLYREVSFRVSFSSTVDACNRSNTFGNITYPYYTLHQSAPTVYL